MQLHNVQSKTKRKKSVQVGRGGKRGKTSGRGTKGQKARAGAKLRPEVRDIIKKIPKLRGRGKNSNLPVKTNIAITLRDLDKHFADGDTVTVDTLNEKKIINAKTKRSRNIKIVKTGELTKKLTITGIATTSGAREAIEGAQGKVTE